MDGEPETLKLLQLYTNYISLISITVAIKCYIC